VDPQTVTAWKDFITVIGFPAAVAGYVLIRLERRLTEVRDAVRDLVQITGGTRAMDRRRPDTPP
jgi:hypothetical protein